MRQLCSALFYRSVKLLTCLTVILLTTSVLQADDWTTYRGNNSRTGGTDQTVETPLSLDWKFSSSSVPRLAWSSGEGRVMDGQLIGHRVKFDDALHPIVVNDKVYFGSSVDHQLRCVDLKSGKTIWNYFTGAPIRLAPTFADGLIYFGSDDGHAYCLKAENGELVWKIRAGREDNWLLARGEMISRWPLRTGVLVDKGVAFFGAGIFPHEDVYIYAVDAKTGKIIWKQDDISTQNAGRNDLSPQGYLLVDDKHLIVPSGRSLPAVIDRKTGKVLYKKSIRWQTDAGGIIGGVRAILADDQLYVSGPHRYVAVSFKTKRTGFGWFEGEQMVVHKDAAYLVDGDYVAKLNRKEYADNSASQHKIDMDIYQLKRSLRGAKKNKVKTDAIKKSIAEAIKKNKALDDIGIVWKTKTDDKAMVLAAGNLIFTGGDGQVTAFSESTGQQVWQAKVDGFARGLIVINDRLLVSATSGKIYCFKHQAAATTSTNKVTAIKEPYPVDKWTAKYAKAAKEILQQSKCNKGYCLVLDAGTGRLAYEIAKQSELKVYAVMKDAKQVAIARKMLSQARLYGHRVTVHHQQQAELPYSNYFANLIVSDDYVRTGQNNSDLTRIARHLKPMGGVLCFGTAIETEVGDKTTEQLLKTVEEKSLPQQIVKQKSDQWTTLTRQALPGAGGWTHQYGNPANTAISDERRVKSGLGVLWYGDPGPGEMVNRHSGAVGPLAVSGKLFVQGETTIFAYDAYNGVFLWKHENPEGMRVGVFKGVSPGNLAASKNRLFHFLQKNCYEIDADSGKIIRVHKLPKEKDDGKHQWAYVAVQDGLLYGTATIMENLAAANRRRGRKNKDATDAIFAIDLKTGKHLWTYQGQSISHRTIAVGPKKLYFIDSSITSDQRSAILREDKSALVNLKGKAKQIAEDRLKKADLRRAVAINSRSGKLEWSHSVDVTDCSEIGIGGGMLTLMYQNGALILGGANANGHYWRQFVAGDFSRRRLVALSADDGYKLWSKDANYRSRPIIIGDDVLAEPWIYNLKTGEQKMTTHPISGKKVPWSIMRTGHHCGILTGCDSGMLMFRSGYTGFYDLKSDAGTRHFAGHRLGCWINAIPANGLVMIPEASAGCVCLFSIASTIVLEPREAQHPWAIYSATGTQTPVKQIALNLGAPGDRKDATGKLWLSYPRYRAYQETSLDIKLNLKPKFSSGGGFKSISEESAKVEGTQNDWLYRSAARNVYKFSVPLLGKKDKPATYHVRLHFADGKEASSFRVKLQGKTVIGNVTLNKKSRGKPIKAVVKEIANIKVTDLLTVQLEKISGKPAICAIEVIRTE